MSERYSFLCCSACGLILDGEEAPEKCPSCKSQGTIALRFSEFKPMTNLQFLDFLNRKTTLLVVREPAELIARLISTVAELAKRGSLPKK